MTTKQRSYLKSMAMTMEPVMRIGKSSLSDELILAIREVLEARELVKLSVLKNCLDSPSEMAAVIASQTYSEVVQVVGRKIVLYKQAYKPENRKIVLPK